MYRLPLGIVTDLVDVIAPDTLTRSRVTSTEVTFAFCNASAVVPLEAGGRNPLVMYLFWKMGWTAAMSGRELAPRGVARR